jgi:hypothetical protein
MSGFLYFLPGCRPGDVGADVLSRYGISHIVDTPKGKVHNRGCIGPNNIQGVVIGAVDRWQAEEVKNSEAIEWQKFPKTFSQERTAAPWLGWVKAAPLPTPAELARTVQLPGELLTLADSHSWLIPVARDFEGVCKLPRAFDLDDETGEWVSTSVRREYAKIWHHANTYHQAMSLAYVEAQVTGNQDLSFIIPDGEALVVDTLSVNYRVSARELATLGVLVSGMAQDIADILTDRHGDPIKKKQANSIGTG